MPSICCAFVALVLAVVPAAAQSAAKGYLIIEHGAVTPAIAEALKPYSAVTRPLLEKHGGRFVVAGGRNMESVEGGWTPPFIGIIEFPSLDAAKAFYREPEYQRVLPIRLKALPDSKAILVEGTAAP